MAKFAVLSLGVSPSFLSWPGWQDLHPKGSSLRSGSRTLSPGLLAGADSSPCPPAHFAQALELLQALSGPWLALTSHLGWIHLLFFSSSSFVLFSFFFNWGIVSFFLADIIFYYRLPLFMYVVHPVSFDVKDIWMVSYWCPFREKPFLPAPTAWKWMHFKMAPHLKPCAASQFSFLYIVL